MVSYHGLSRALITLPSAAYTSSVPASCTVDTSGINYLAWDITLTSFTGGTAPTIQFLIERQGTDGVWYQVSSTGALNTAPQTISVDISRALAGTTAAPLTSTTQHAVLTQNTRMRWVFGGTANPTAVTFSASLVGSA